MSGLVMRRLEQSGRLVVMTRVAAGWQILRRLRRVLHMECVRYGEGTTGQKYGFVD